MALPTISLNMQGRNRDFDPPSFQELPEDAKQQLREEIITFLRERCRDILSLGLDADTIIREPDIVEKYIDQLIGEGKIKKGKRKLVLTRMHELQRMLDATLRLDKKTEGAAENREPDDPRVRETIGRRIASIRWACETVWPALKELADGDLCEWNSLEKARATLPQKKKRRAWGELVRATRQTLALDDDMPAENVPSDQWRFIHLLRMLNERWFMENGMFLMRMPDERKKYAKEGDAPSPLWDYVRVGIHSLEATQVYQFHDTHVPVVYIRSIYPLPPEVTPHIAYDGVQECVVMTINVLEQNIYLLKELYDSIAKPNPELEKSMLESGETAASVEAWKEYARIIVAQYDNLPRMYAEMEARTLLEELRHGIDAKRARALMGADIPKYGYYPAFANAMLSPQGQMRAVFEACEDENEKMIFGGAISELSAQMTAAALSPNHTLMLSEWRKFAFERSHRQFDPDNPRGLVHGEASAYALLLLGQEMNMIPPATAALQPRGLVRLLSMLKHFFSGKKMPLSFQEPDYRRLLKVADELLQRSPQEIRIALKNIYSREFALGQIDEYPFYEITSDGEIQPRENQMQ